MGQPTPIKKKRRTINSIDLMLIGPERDQFLESFSLLISSGMGVLVALDGLKSDARSSTMRKIIEQMHGDVDAGRSLSDSFADTGILSQQVISLIRIGEDAGRLPENLKVVATQQQKERLFQSKLISAMIYPILVFTVTVTVGLLVAWFVLPRLSTVFSQLQIKLPLITRALISLGVFLGHYGFIAVPVAILLILLSIYLVFIAKPTRIIGERLTLAMPGFRRVIVEVELARFGYIIGTLLEAGLPVVDALDSIADATPFTTYRRLYQHLKRNIEEGNSFHKSLQSYPNTKALIPIPIQQLVNAAEQSGTLSATFIKIGELYDEKTDVTTKNLVVIIEPVLLVAVWVGVLLVAIAVILPIYSLVGQFNAGVDSPSPPIVSEPTTTSPSTSSFAPTEPSVLGARDPAPQLAAPVVAIILTVKSDGLAFLNVRDRPSSMGAVVGRVQPLDSLVAIDVADGWYKITMANGGTGWVSSQFVTVTQP